MLTNYKKMDINMLLSIVNMKLRNEKSTLEQFCRIYQLDKQVLQQRFERHGFIFDAQQRQFKQHP